MIKNSNSKYFNTEEVNEKEEFLRSKIQKKISLKPYNSWKVGGEADYFSKPKSIEELKTLLMWAQLSSKPVTFLGGGSNVLISDEGVEGLVICLDQLKGYELQESKHHLHITALAGTLKSDLLKIFLKYRLPPALFLIGLPGHIGGGVVMNAGMGEGKAPSQFSDIVSWVEVLETKNNPSSFVLKRIPSSKIQWSYRQSLGWQPGVIVRVGFLYPKTKDPLLLQKVKTYSKKRIQTQPLQYCNCGSVFKNPRGYKSGALIEESGLKNFRWGGARISEKHANFIINDQEASAQNIHRIIQHVQTVVREKKRVSLQTEIRYIGRGWKNEPNYDDLTT